MGELVAQAGDDGQVPSGDALEGLLPVVVVEPSGQVDEGLQAIGATEAGDLDDPVGTSTNGAPPADPTKNFEAWTFMWHFRSFRALQVAEMAAETAT